MWLDVRGQGSAWALSPNAVEDTLTGAMSVSVDIISIGTLSRNILWNEGAAVRPAHATTTLIRDGGVSILVDPALPGEVLQHRLDERAGLKPEQIDVVFLTSFSPVHRRGLALFSKADWYISRLERDTVLDGLNALSNHSGSTVENVSYEDIQAEIELLGRLKPAPDKLASQVDFFPSYGAAPGNASLLVQAARTIVVAGDAVVTRDYFDQRRVWDRSSDPEKAKESFQELSEIADAIVPGHDNVIYLG